MSRLKKHNPVAKFMHRFNKAATFKDKKNDYVRNEKHKEKIQDIAEESSVRSERTEDSSEE